MIFSLRRKRLLYTSSDFFLADDLFWKVEKKILQYGEDLSLSCQVDSCCPETAGWGKWTFKNELTTIFIDVKNLDANDKSKYAGGTDMNGFSLVIRNLSKEDLNIAYSCTYGFLISQKKFLLETDAFNCEYRSSVISFVQ